MRIKYITNVRLPTPRAQGYAIMKVCSEFAKAGAEVELYIPDRKAVDIEKDPFVYYSIEKNFEITRIRSFDFLSGTQKFGGVLYWLDILSFFLMAKFKIKFKPEDTIYSRDYLTALFFSKNNSLSLEIHDIPGNTFFFKKAIKNPKLFFVLNQNLKNDLIGLGVEANKIYISPSGVDIEEFDINIDKAEARERLDLPKEAKIVLYTGHLYRWKGVDTLAEAAKFLPEVLFVFVGGVRPELQSFTTKYKKYSNIIVRPSVERSIIPTYLKSADGLALPNSERETISAKYTSPIKMFEYMAAQKPIVASDLPSVREVLNEQNCFFAEADNPESFAETIREIFSNQKLAENVVQNSFRKAKQYTWQAKARNILKHINENSL